jgi:CRISPR-associated protein Cas5h
MGKLVSFDVSSDFGFFKKPDINEFSLTYNLPPKPVILGIIGSILGMNGLDKQHEETVQLKELLNIEDMLSRDYNKTKRLVKKIDFDLVHTVLESLKFEKRDRLLELLKILENKKEKDFDFNEFNEILEELKAELQFPEYYRKLKHLKIGIKPLVDRKNFPFNKTMNKYNSRNSYFGGAKYENIPISEQLLIKPEYRIYIYENDVKILDELAERIKNNNPIFMPYLGKNEFIVNFDNLEIIDEIEPITSEPVHISSIFLRIENNEDGHYLKTDKMKRPSREGSVAVTGLPQGFKFLEHYPVSYSEGMHYNLQVAEFTARSDEISTIDLEKGKLVKIHDEIIYLF